MNFNRFLSPESIQLFDEPCWLDSEDEEEEDLTPYQFQQRKEQILSDIAELMSASGKIKNVSKLRTSLINNEKRFSSAIGCGVAIPHVRCMQSRNLTMGFARFTSGIDFDAPDEEKVQIFIAMTAPPYDDRLYLRVYKAIATAFLETDVKEALLTVDNPGEIIRTFNRYFI